MCKVSKEVRLALASVLGGVLRIVKPYARLDVRCLAEVLIDYYLGLSFRLLQLGVALATSAYGGIGTR